MSKNTKLIIKTIIVAIILVFMFIRGSLSTRITMAVLFVISSIFWYVECFPFTRFSKRKLGEIQKIHLSMWNDRNIARCLQEINDLECDKKVIFIIRQ